jgi:hypothetical protein
MRGSPLLVLLYSLPLSPLVLLHLPLLRPLLLPH